MARDGELLAAAERGDCGGRVYGWSGVWVSLGRFQRAEDALLADVPWVVRPTGGLAVLHGHDVTFAFAVTHDLRSTRGRSLKDLYRSMVRPLVEALRSCGLDASLCEDTPYSGAGSKTGDCFAFSSPNDVVDRVTGHKLCGCAMRVTESAALLQASIPYREPEVPASRILAGGVDAPVARWEHPHFADAMRRILSSDSELPELRPRQDL